MVLQTKFKGRRVLCKFFLFFQTHFWEGTGELHATVPRPACAFQEGSVPLCCGTETGIAQQLTGVLSPDDLVDGFLFQNRTEVEYC